MSSPADPIAVTLAVAAAIERAGGRYFVGGSLASSLQGEPPILKSPEDTVLRKLRWFEDGGRVSERQWRDVVQVLRVAGSALDGAYLARWAPALGVEELLRDALAEATRSV